MEITWGGGTGKCATEMWKHLFQSMADHVQFYFEIIFQTRHQWSLRYPALVLLLQGTLSLLQLIAFEGDNYFWISIYVRIYQVFSLEQIHTTDPPPPFVPGFPATLSSITCKINFFTFPALISSVTQHFFLLYS